VYQENRLKEYKSLINTELNMYGHRNTDIINESDEVKAGFYLSLSPNRCAKNIIEERIKLAKATKTSLRFL
jgi:hypothetical protein